MSARCQSSAINYFDSIAPKWDSMHDLNTLTTIIDSRLDTIGIKPDEHMLDVGCGTGNLTAALVRRLLVSGRVTAIDLSSNMIEIAQQKVNDQRVYWICGAVEHLGNSAIKYDRVICFSTWRYLKNIQVAARVFLDILKPGGTLNIWEQGHRDSTKIIFEKFDTVDSEEFVSSDETVSTLKQLGFSTESTLDDNGGYQITARKSSS